MIHPFIPALHLKTDTNQEMKKYPKIRIVYGRRRPNSKGECSVEIEISHEGKRKWISTGVSVLPRYWKERQKKIVGISQAFDLNLKIEASENFISNYIRKQIVNERDFSWAALDAAMKTSTNSGSFIEFVARQIEESTDKAPNTIKNYKAFLSLLKRYGKIQTFSDIDKPSILRFDDWLHKCNYIQPTIANYHKFMKVFLNKAMAQELISSYPYTGIRISKGKSRMRRYLEMDELHKIEIAEMSTTSQKRVRDLFLFQCYTGMSYADMQRFDISKVEQRGNKYILRDTRQKTEEEYTLVLLPQAMEILARYNNKLPITSNQKYNLRLKEVGELADVNIKLTSHMGCHTYATMCLNIGISIETISKMLGHTDIKTTQIYAKMLHKSVEEASEKIEQELIRLSKE